MLTRSLEVCRTAGYHLSSQPGPEVGEVWYLLHGYATLASEFLATCGTLASPRRLLVAPEGLSRFYRRGTGGAVGASWMTREAREAEIADQASYLDRLRAELARELRPGIPVHVLGFSQGAAAACRWAVHGENGVACLILWCGGVPPDLDLAAARARLAEAEPILVFGRRDEWIDEAAVAREEARLRDAGIGFRTVRFDGTHAIEPELLLSLAGPRGGAGA